MTDKLYADRNIEDQGEYYDKHIAAMTSEGLRAKSDIAAELAHRDIQIDKLRKIVKALADWSLRYPPEQIYGMGHKDKMDGELRDIEEAAKAAAYSS